jgi:hypothetical protein
MHIKKVGSPSRTFLPLLAVKLEEGAMVVRTFHIEVPLRLAFPLLLEVKELEEGATHRAFLIWSAAWSHLPHIHPVPHEASAMHRLHLPSSQANI